MGETREPEWVNSTIHGGPEWVNSIQGGPEWVSKVSSLETNILLWGLVRRRGRKFARIIVLSFFSCSYVILCTL